MGHFTRTLAPLGLALLLAPVVACEGSAGGFTHATAPGTVDADLTTSVAGSDPATRAYHIARAQECRSGLVSLSIGEGQKGTKKHPALASLYLKPPRDFAGTGFFDLKFANGKWLSKWSVDGTVAHDTSRGIAPFAMQGSGAIDGTVTILSDKIEGDVRTLAGLISMKTAGDPQHEITVMGRFSASYTRVDGCP